MADYKVGYCKPPLENRFKAGVSGNPNGRPKRQTNSLAESVVKALGAPIKYRERTKTKSATCGELAMRMLVDRAASGDVSAARTLLKAYATAERNGNAGVEKILIKNWISTDRPGTQNSPTPMK